MTSGDDANVAHRQVGAAGEKNAIAKIRRTPINNAPSNRSERLSIETADAVTHEASHIANSNDVNASVGIGRTAARRTPIA